MFLHGGDGMEIMIGSEVHGTDGKLGEVQGVIADARTDTITDLVVKHGFIFKDARIVPLVHVVRVEDGAVYLDLDEGGFKAMDGFTEEIQGPNPDYVGPPDYDLQGTHRGNFIYKTQVASFGQLGGKPLGYPGGEKLTPDFRQRPSIASGDDVLDATGERIGEVGEFGLDPETGAPTRLTVKQGALFKRETELPTDWVEQLSDDGVVLTVTKDEVEARIARS
jgi:uncharacterized protein YrrD